MSTQNMTKVLVGEDVLYAMQCPNNTYKTTLGNTTCTPCPAQSTSPPASIDKEGCKCLSNLKLNVDCSCDRVCAAGFEVRTDCTLCCRGGLWGFCFVSYDQIVWIFGAKNPNPKLLKVQVIRRGLPHCSKLGKDP